MAKLSLHKLLTKESHTVTLPNRPKYYHHTNAFKHIFNADAKAQLDSKIALGAYHWLIENHTYFVAKGYCALSNEPLRIHYCGYLDDGVWRKYEISVLNGYNNRNHPNFKRYDKVCIAEVEVR